MVYIVDFFDINGQLIMSHNAEVSSKKALLKFASERVDDIKKYKIVAKNYYNNYQELTKEISKKTFNKEF